MSQCGVNLCEKHFVIYSSSFDSFWRPNDRIISATTTVAVATADISQLEEIHRECRNKSCQQQRKKRKMRKIEILGELCLQLSVPKFQENPRHLLFNACSASVLRFSHENTWPWFKTEKISNKIAFLAIFTGKGISSTHSFVLLWSLHVLYFGYSLLPQFTVGKRVCYAWKQKQWFQPIWINYVNCSFFLLFSRQNKKKLLFCRMKKNVSIFCSSIMSKLKWRFHFELTLILHHIFTDIEKHSNFVINSSFFPFKVDSSIQEWHFWLKWEGGVFTCIKSNVRMFFEAFEEGTVSKKLAQIYLMLTQMSFVW